MFSGATAALSKVNIMNWLDTTIQGLCKNNVLVHAGRNREWGFFHHLSLYEFLETTSVLSSALTQWGHDCAVHDYSLGRV